MGSVPSFSTITTKLMHLIHTENYIFLRQAWLIINHECYISALKSYETIIIFVHTKLFQTRTYQNNQIQDHI